MSKVTAPLGSFSASGKIGKTLVFFSHLGRNVVRGLVTPNNPQTETQGDSRLFLGAIGRAAKAVVNTSAWYNDANSVTPSGQTWVSYLIRNLSTLYGANQTGISDLQDDVDTHTATNWETAADGAGLGDLSIPYAGTVSTLTAGAMLYAIARHSMAIKASNPSLFDRTPYTTDLASWTSADVDSFVSDIQTAA